MTITSPYYCRDIEKAVQHPLWNEEERQGLIDRHHLRTANKSAGKNLEMTGGITDER